MTRRSVQEVETAAARVAREPRLRQPDGRRRPGRGETVLDLGSGGGIDVLLSARRVGPSGFVYGLDMTDEMLELARENGRKAEVTNVEFPHGFIEDIPLPDASVDVIISNCVINLSTDKPRVIREMFRTLRPGGRLGISDIVAADELSLEERAERGSYVGCIGRGAVVRGVPGGARLGRFHGDLDRPNAQSRRRDARRDRESNKAGRLIRGGRRGRSST